MNVTGIVRYTASLTSVGTVAQTSSLTAPAGASGPSLRGKILRVEAVKVAGPATVVNFSFREGVAGPIRWQFTAEPYPVAKQSYPIPYEISSPSDLILEVSTDDGTNATDIDFEVDIEGPF